MSELEDTFLIICYKIAPNKYQLQTNIKQDASLLKGLSSMFPEALSFDIGKDKNGYYVEINYLSEEQELNWQFLKLYEGKHFSELPDNYILKDAWPLVDSKGIIYGVYHPKNEFEKEAYITAEGIAENFYIPHPEIHISLSIGASPGILFDEIVKLYQGINDKDEISDNLIEDKKWIKENYPNLFKKEKGEKAIILHNALANQRWINERYGLEIVELSIYLFKIKMHFKAKQEDENEPTLSDLKRLLSAIKYLAKLKLY